MLKAAVKITQEHRQFKVLWQFVIGQTEEFIKKYSVTFAD
jgi:hypothetical protein